MNTSLSAMRLLIATLTAGLMFTTSVRADEEGDGSMFEDFSGTGDEVVVEDEVNLEDGMSEEGSGGEEIYWTTVDDGGEATIDDESVIYFTTMDGGEEVANPDEVLEMTDGEVVMPDGDGEVTVEMLPLMSGAAAPGSMSDSPAEYVDVSKVSEVEVQTEAQGDIVTQVGAVESPAATTAAIETGSASAQIRGGRLTVDGAIAK